MDPMTYVGNHESGSAVTAEEPQIRVDKVLDIKRQLAEGRYEMADKLDVVVDRLLEDLL
jgi:anti-sigma28 factor (negative regulator of flagellin synthesis)